MCNEWNALQSLPSGGQRKRGGEGSLDTLGGGSSGRDGMGIGIGRLTYSRARGNKMTG